MQYNCLTPVRGGAPPPAFVAPLRAQGASAALPPAIFPLSRQGGPSGRMRGRGRGPPPGRPVQQSPGGPSAVPRHKAVRVVSGLQQARTTVHVAQFPRGPMSGGGLTLSEQLQVRDLNLANQQEIFRMQLGERFGAGVPPISLWRLSHFDVIRTIGTGNYTRVKLVRHRYSKRFFALKVLPKAETLRLNQVAHVHNEKEILRVINHPFIARLERTFQDERHLYILQEYVAGGELFTHLRNVGKFPNDVAKFYAAELVLALEYLHTHDIVYRDIKPENLLINSDGHVKLIDFGFSKRVKNRTWSMCGTADYLAPEIVRATGHSFSADWWSFGVLLFEMLVGHPPFFDSGSLYNTYEKILSGKVEFPVFLNVHARDLIHKLLSVDPARRLGSLRNGPEDIRKHPWFSGVDWNDVYRKAIFPPIPIFVNHPGDPRYFKFYEESGEGHQSPVAAQESLTPEQQALFRGF